MYSNKQFNPSTDSIDVLADEIVQYIKGNRPEFECAREPGDGKVKPKMESVDEPVKTPGLIAERMSLLLKYVIGPLEEKKARGETLTPEEETDLANAKAERAKFDGEA